MNQHTNSPTNPIDVSSSLFLPATLAILLGVFLILGTGFAHPDIIHNAAHDTRHAFTFPCH
jgi:cobalt transporter subunit CbtB